MTQEHEQQEEAPAKPHDHASMVARMNIDIKLNVHLDDGTVKPLHLVAHNFKVEKEQKE